MTTADQLAARAMTLAAGACDDDQAVAELCRLAVGNDHALDQAILACLARPASLAAWRSSCSPAPSTSYSPSPSKATVRFGLWRTASTSPGNSAGAWMPR
jgi:hypothetical protein